MEATKVRESCSALREAPRETLQLLHVILENIATSPLKKFRRLNTRREKIQLVWSTPACRAVLEACGFGPSDREEGYLVADSGEEITQGAKIAVDVLVTLLQVDSSAGGAHPPPLPTKTPSAASGEIRCPQVSSSLPEDLQRQQPVAPLSAGPPLSMPPPTNPHLPEDSDDVDTLSVKDLKGLIAAAGLSYADCVEKSQLRERAREARGRPAQISPVIDIVELVPALPMLSEQLPPAVWAAKWTDASIFEKLFFVCVSGSDNLTLVKALLSKEQDMLGATHDFGITPLGAAAQGGCVAVVDELLARGAKVDSPDTCGACPLWAASELGHLAIVRSLLKHGAEVDRGRFNGDTALVMAAQNGHAEVVDELLARGAEVNKAATDGVTPLFVACKKGHLTIMRVLLEHGALMTAARTTDGVTPLGVAAGLGQTSVVRELLARGADPSVGASGYTAARIAKQEGYHDIAALLEDACKASSDGSLPAQGVATSDKDLDTMSIPCPPGHDPEVWADLPLDLQQELSAASQIQSSHGQHRSSQQPELVRPQFPSYFDQLPREEQERYAQSIGMSLNDLERLFPNGLGGGMAGNFAQPREPHFAGPPAVKSWREELSRGLEFSSIILVEQALQMAATAGVDNADVQLQRGKLFLAGAKAEAVAAWDKALSSEDPSTISRVLVTAGHCVDGNRKRQAYDILGKTRHSTSHLGENVHGWNLLHRPAWACTPMSRLAGNRIPLGPDAIDTALRTAATQKAPAKHDVKYWTGAMPPWRDGTTDAAIIDAAVIAREETHKEQVEAEDKAVAPTEDDHANLLWNCGINVQFLLFMTFELNLWEWKVWEIVQFLVKPLSEAHNRCRFAHLDFIKPFTGPADVFMSHCWGGSWGDFVASACTGASEFRFIWIDIFAVRQWPGNVADLDFRRVIERCSALVVALSPTDGIVSREIIPGDWDRELYLQSAEYQQAKKILAFCRLWCVVEMYSAVQAGKTIVFRCNKVLLVTGSVANVGTEGADIMLENFQSVSMIDVERCESAVQADKDRELAKIANTDHLNRTVRSAVRAGCMPIKLSCFEVDSYACGEKEALRLLSPSRSIHASVAAAALGQSDAFYELLVQGHLDLSSLGSNDSMLEAVFKKKLSSLSSNDALLDALWSACSCGQVEVVKAILAMGADITAFPTAIHPTTLLFIAAQNGHESIAQLLLVAGAEVNTGDRRTGRTPLYIASQNNCLEVVKLLITAEADIDQVNTRDFFSPLFMAAKNGHLKVVHALLKAGADPNLIHPNNTSFYTPLLIAQMEGHMDVCEALLAGAADPAASQSFMPADLASLFESEVQRRLSNPGSSASEINKNVDENCENIDALSVKDLKGLIAAAGLSYADCVEKSQLRERAQAARARSKPPLAAPAPAPAPAPAQAQAPAPPPPMPNLTNDISVHHIHTKLLQHPAAIRHDAFKILLTLVTNLKDHPRNEKYRTISTSKEAIKKKLLGLEGAHELLYFIGFQPGQEDPHRLTVSTLPSPEVLSMEIEWLKDQISRVSAWK